MPPFVTYLNACAGMGVDVGYLVTGQRAGDAAPLAPEERAMLAAWRNAPPALREAALAVLACGGAAANGNGGVAVATGHGHAVALGNGAHVSGSLVGNTLVVGDQDKKQG